MKNQFGINDQELIEMGAQKKEEYLSNDPFPHMVFQNFFPENLLDQILDEFPDFATLDDKIEYEDKNEIKFASDGETVFGEKTKNFLHYLNSQPFLYFLSNLTGIQDLIPDPEFIGGGFHELKKGGFLNIHADFNKHKHTGLDRRINILVYLNKDWKDSYGGQLELWNTDMKECVRKVIPGFNTVVVFNTTDFSYHGNPEPVQCPEGQSRKSIALYYYTNGRPEREVNTGLEDHSTLFKERPVRSLSAEKKKVSPAKTFLKKFIPPIFIEIVQKIMK